MGVHDVEALKDSFFAAIETGDVETVTDYLQYLSVPSFWVDDHGRSTIEVARENNQAEIERILREDPTFRDDEERYRKALKESRNDTDVPSEYDAEKLFELKKKEGDEKPLTQMIAPRLVDINHELLQFLSRHPSHLYELTSRKFEELVARILQDAGFDVELTRPTRDGGRDIIAHIRNEFCSLLTFVECKKYSPSRKVGVEVVRSVYGVQRMHQANKSLIVTTSFFSEPAKEEQRMIANYMELHDYDNLRKWLSRYQN